MAAALNNTPEREPSLETTARATAGIKVIAKPEINEKSRVYELQDVNDIDAPALPAATTKIAINNHVGVSG